MEANQWVGGAGWPGGLAEKGIFSESDRQSKPPATRRTRLARQPLIYKRFNFKYPAQGLNQEIRCSDIVASLSSFLVHWNASCWLDMFVFPKVTATRRWHRNAMR
jgi:hypothetical protein